MHRIESAATLRGSLMWASEVTYNLIVIVIVAILVRNSSCYLSKVGKYAFGIMCAHELMFNSKPADCSVRTCHSTFGISLRGFVILPSLDDAVAMASGYRYGAVQLSLVPIYVFITILIVCVPFQLLFECFVGKFMNR